MGRKGRRPNLKIQMHKEIDSKIAIGVSRHAIKKATGDNSSPFIHSTATADAYRQTINEFSAWLKKDSNSVWSTKDLDAITKDVAYQYLQERQEQGLSAWTVTKDMSAINKVLDLQLTKKEGSLKQRRVEDIKRSREPKAHDLKYNPKNYIEQIDIAKAFGLRRESIKGGNYAVKESSFFIKNNKIHVSVIEKGGRYRESPCLDKYKDTIAARYELKERDSFTKDEFIEHYVSDKSDVLFQSYTSKIDNHAFRAEYAQDLYKELIVNVANPQHNYYGYDSRIIKEVSEALGHARFQVVVKHYL